MRLVSRRTIREFVDSLAGHKDQQAVRSALLAWAAQVEVADWASGADVRRDYATASLVGAERVVFNVKGNDYRLVAAIDYRPLARSVWIKWIGTHAEYDRIDVRTIEHRRQGS